MEGTGVLTAIGTAGNEKAGRVAKGIVGGGRVETGIGGGGVLLLTGSSAEALDTVSERYDSMMS